jgi:YHS domain-containing protein
LGQILFQSLTGKKQYYFCSELLQGTVLVNI